MDEDQVEAQRLAIASLIDIVQELCVASQMGLQAEPAWVRQVGETLNHHRKQLFIRGPDL